ncbi:MAG: sulfite exporter TauE/SafE family protein [Pseudomonadota bacterium]
MPALPGLASAWLLGLSLGLTACTVTCLPFMGTWVLARGASTAWSDTLAFLAGRVCAYAALGFAAGMAGAWLATALERGIGHAAIGLASVGAGAWLLAGRGQRGCGLRRKADGLSPFALGFSLSLVPCAPLASLLAFAAQAGSSPLGAGYGLAFGLGTAVTPLLLVLPLLGRFGERLRQERAWLSDWLRRGGGLVLVILGLYRIRLGA